MRSCPRLWKSFRHKARDATKLRKTPDKPPLGPVYLDHAATTPMRASAKRAWLETVDELSARPGNPSSLHAGGRGARLLLEQARERLAEALGAERAEVVFTSGATESAALGVTGAALGRKSKLPESEWTWLLSGVEHPAVLEQRVPLRATGITHLMIPLQDDGVIDLDEDALASRTAGREIALGSLAMVCSETGVIQPLEEFTQICRRLAPGAYVHSDATQAIGNLPVSFSALGLDLMTIGGHKFGAPVGTGALLVKRGVALKSDRPGGGHERGIRSGTPDVAGAVSLSVAAQEAVGELGERRRVTAKMRAKLLGGLPEQVALTTTAGAVESIVHLSLPTAHPEVILLEMDRQGIHVSAGSACHAGVTRPSSVLLHMGRDEHSALGVLRVSMSATTSEEEIDRFLAALPHALEQAQRMDQYDLRGSSRSFRRKGGEMEGQGVPK